MIVFHKAIKRINPHNVLHTCTRSIQVSQGRPAKYEEKTGSKKTKREKGEKRRRETGYKGELAILYNGKLDLKSKTKISPADLISVVLCRDVHVEITFKL